MRLRFTTPTLPLLVLLPIVLGGCSSDGPRDFDPEAGGAGAAKAGSGQNQAAGSAGKASGGTSAAGSGNATSGAPSFGGASGGSSPTAGAGGPSPTAGAGGSSPTAGAGGAAGAGGPVTTDKWTFAEDPGAACTVGAMPAVGSLTANNKLPDPFKKMNGMAMTSKSEWLCRREEILQQGFEYIYGKKPRPAKEAVTGTVSTSSISVSVTDGGKTGTFTASVGGSCTTKPCPAIIGFGGVSGMPVPSGIATINFNATAVAPEGNGSNPGSGAFYNVYGPTHEAGLLAAWAWGISRIIDVIEKNPGTIDPTKIAVTGCSRFGKGAFVAGVLDNRIALTIPVESGVGGTPALRLIEQLDSYSGSEWPYHAISYQQWFSPEKLGQFATANNAGGDNTNKIPVDMHQMMALIAPRGLYIVDNPSTMYNGLDRNSAYATGLVGQMVFKALGLGDNITYQGASGDHCSWRSAYTAPLTANLDKFLRGSTTAKTGTFATDLGGTKPTAEGVIDWTAPTLAGEL
jgi:hypothetical protein